MRKQVTQQTKSIGAWAIFAAFLLLLLASHAVSAQEQALKIHYSLAMSRPASHLFQVNIAVHVPDEMKVASLDFQMPKWSPGRYAVFDFAKNVQEFGAVNCASDGDCIQTPLEVTRIDDQTWRVYLTRRRDPIVYYKVFANDLSGTFSQLDARHANINGGCVFMYVVNHKQDPVALSINAPPGWHVVNGATRKKDQTDFQFPNWDLMTDTPTEISADWTDDSFDVGGKTYRVVVHSLGNEGGKRPALVRDIEKIVRAETAMWGPPEFDSYTFLIHFANDGHSGDGMEHLNSTQIILPGSLADEATYQETLDDVAHEFFHVWNVKRLRPVELGPWDFTRPANTRGLWIAEGFTNYYGHLMLRRAGLSDNQKFFSTLGEQIAEIENSPGSKLMSAEESSLVAPFIDDAPHAQQTNLANSSISYYAKGETIALVLDLLIRGKTNGKASLDEVMRCAYEEFYFKSPSASYYLRGRGYRDEEFEKVVSDIAGTDMSDFFKRYVHGVETPPYEEAFARIGLRFVRQPRTPVTIGLSADESDQTNFKIAAVRAGSPAADAGLEIGDVIASFGGLKLTPTNFLKVLARYKPNDRVALNVTRDGKPLTITIVLAAPQVFDYRIEEDANASNEMKALRVAWLNGK